MIHTFASESLKNRAEIYYMHGDITCSNTQPDSSVAPAPKGLSQWVVIQCLFV